LKIPAELLVLKYLLYAWTSSRIPFIARKLLRQLAYYPIEGLTT
jgi:hypothetical protein